MPRVKGGPAGHRRHKKILLAARGYRMSRNRIFKRANEAVLRAGKHAFEGRKQRRRDMRTLWISRINGALTAYNMKYSRFIAALKSKKIELDRKSIAEMAVNDPASFEKLVKSL